nr:1376_t:CDS:2 [Entrophospora candida]
MDFAKNLIQLSSTSSNTKEEDHLISQINEYIKLYEKIEEREIELNNQINSYHEKIQQTGVIAPKIKEALKSLYADMIDQTKRKRKERQGIVTLSSPPPKKSKKPVENSKLNSIIKNETIVAAKQPEIKSLEQNWILATIVRYKLEVKLYEAVDADQFEASNRHFNVPNKNVLPIANKGEIKTNEFTKDHPVLAFAQKCEETQYVLDIPKGDYFVNINAIAITTTF